MRNIFFVVLALISCGTEFPDAHLGAEEKWNCFRSSEIDAECIEVVSGDERRYDPTLSILADDVLYEYTVSGNGEVDCLSFKNRWVELLERSQKICLLGRFVQDFPTTPNDEFKRWWLYDLGKMSADNEVHAIFDDQ